jgi:hypothetical protein
MNSRNACCFLGGKRLRYALLRLVRSKRDEPGCDILKRASVQREIDLKLEPRTYVSPSHAPVADVQYRVEVRYSHVVKLGSICFLMKHVTMRIERGFIKLAETHPNRSSRQCGGKDGSRRGTGLPILFSY